MITYVNNVVNFLLNLFILSYNFGLLFNLILESQSLHTLILKTIIIFIDKFHYNCYYYSINNILMSNHHYFMWLSKRLFLLAYLHNIHTK